MILKLLMNTRIILKKIEEYNPNRKRKMLFVFDDVIADMLSNRKRNPTVTELFIRSRKLKIYLCSAKKC